MIYHKFSIADLRNLFPSNNLGNRERILLHEKGARVSKTTTFGMYKVTGKDSYFEFTYKCPNYADFTVVG